MGVRLRRGRGWGGLLAGMPLLGLLVLPLLALGLNLDYAGLWAHLASPMVLQALALSLGTGSTAALLVVLLGTPLSYLLARRTGRLQIFVETLVELPMVLPPAAQTPNP